MCASAAGRDKTRPVFLCCGRSNFRDRINCLIIEMKGTGRGYGREGIEFAENSQKKSLPYVDIR